MSSKFQKVFYTFFGACASVVSAQYVDDHSVEQDFADEHIEASISDWELRQNLSIGALLYADIDIKGKGINTTVNKRSESVLALDPRNNSVSSYSAKSDAKPRSLHAEAGFRLVSPSKHYGFGLTVFTGGAVPLVVANQFEGVCPLQCKDADSNLLNVLKDNVTSALQKGNSNVNICPHYAYNDSGTCKVLPSVKNGFEVYTLSAADSASAVDEVNASTGQFHVSQPIDTKGTATTGDDTIIPITGFTSTATNTNNNAEWNTTAAASSSYPPVLATSSSDIVDGQVCAATRKHGTLIGAKNHELSSSNYYFAKPTRDCSVDLAATNKAFADRTFYNHLQAVQFEGLYQMNRFNFVGGFFLGRSLTATQPFLDTKVFSSLGVNGLASSEEYRYLDYKTTAYPVYGVSMNVEYEVFESDEYAFSLSAFGKYAMPVDSKNIYGEQFGASEVGSTVNDGSSSQGKREFKDSVTTQATSTDGSPNPSMETGIVTANKVIALNTPSHTMLKHEGANLIKSKTVTNLNHTNYVVAGITLSMSKKIDG